MLKLVDVRKKNVLQRWGTQTRKAGVARMTWLPGPATAAGAASSISNAASITFNGTVEVWDPLTQTMMHSIRNAGADTVVMAPRGGDLVLCTKQGDVRVLPLTGKDAEKDSKIKVRRRGAWGNDMGKRGCSGPCDRAFHPRCPAHLSPFPHPCSSTLASRSAVAGCTAMANWPWEAGRMTCSCGTLRRVCLLSRPRTCL